MRTHTASRRSELGVTLIELMVAISISGIVIIGLFRFFTSVFNSYLAQEESSTAHHDAHFAITRLTDILMDAGGDLPGDRMTVITTAGTEHNDFTILTNPRNALHEFQFGFSGARIPVQNARGFIGAGRIKKVPADTTILPTDPHRKLFRLATLSLPGHRTGSFSTARHCVSTTQTPSSQKTSIPFAFSSSTRLVWPWRTSGPT